MTSRQLASVLAFLTWGCSPPDVARACRDNSDCYRREFCTAGCSCAETPTSIPSECPIGSDAGSTGDAGSTVDAGPPEVDGGDVDAGIEVDAGALDASVNDAGSDDAGLDSGVFDAGRQDAGAPDAGAPDAGASDAGAPDAGAPDAGAPDAGAGCGPATCPTGCCLFGTCTPISRGSCGPPGGSCSVCSVQESCSGGRCACGATPSCGVGTRCLANQCVCDSTSCPNGCCRGDGGCEPGTALDACGGGGFRCENCLPNARVDRCHQSSLLPRACRCGPLGDTCFRVNEVCSYGACGTCSQANCGDGCCNNNTCVPRVAFMSSMCGRSRFPSAPCVQCPSGSMCNRNVGDCLWPDGGVAP